MNPPAPFAKTAADSPAEASSSYDGNPIARHHVRIPCRQLRTPIHAPCRAGPFLHPLFFLDFAGFPDWPRCAALAPPEKPVTRCILPLRLAHLRGPGRAGKAAASPG